MKIFLSYFLTRAACVLALSGCFFWTVPDDAQAQDPASSLQAHEMRTQWPGITFRIVEIRRILQNRLLVIVAIKANKDAPARGIFLGTPVEAPPHTLPENLILYQSKPFSLMGSAMTDELTGVQYPSLPPIAPPNMAYFPASTLQTFRPGLRDILSIQFDTPPPPPPPALGQPPVVQTLSFSFPKATGPIVHVPLPPPVVAGAKAP